jgi:hypothetical protein
MNGGDDPTFCHCHDPVPLENCLSCLNRALFAMTKSRDLLADLARKLAEGEYPPSSVECRALIDRLAGLS